jgi:hypothetical protein
MPISKHKSTICSSVGTDGEVNKLLDMRCKSAHPLDRSMAISFSNSVSKMISVQFEFWHTLLRQNYRMYTPKISIGLAVIIQ